jgi:hypothetical protein
VSVIDTLRSVLRRHGWQAGADLPLLDGARRPRDTGDGCHPQRIALRPLLATCGAIAFLGPAIEPLGLVLATAGALLLAGFAGPPPRPLSGALQVGALAALGWLVFSQWLGLDLPIAPDF